MFCPTCGAKNPATATTCVECSRALQAAVPAQAPAQPPLILRRPGPLAPPTLDALPKKGTPALAPTAPRVDTATTAPLVETPAPPRAAPTLAPTAPRVDTATTEPMIETPVPPRTAPPPAQPASLALATPTPVVPPPPAKAPLAPVVDTATTEPSFSPPAAPIAASPQAPPVATPEAARPPAPSPPAPAKPPAAAPVAAAPAPQRPATPAVEPKAAPAPAITDPPHTVATPPPRANATRASASPRLPARARRRLTVATATRQLGAGLIDGVGIAIVTFAFMRLVLAQQGTRPTLQGVVDALHVDVMTGLPLVLMVPVAAVLWHLLAVPLVGTPGQRALGLALTTMTGARPGAGRLAVRAAVQGVAVGAFLAGPAFALFIDGRRRGPGDIVARTVAVRREAPSAHGEAPASRDGVKG